MWEKINSDQRHFAECEMFKKRSVERIIILILGIVLVRALDYDTYRTFLATPEEDVLQM